MLHIILLILRIIGIILLSILGLALLITCAVLFVPIRYNGKGRYMIGGKPEGSGKVTWLLGIIRAEAGYLNGSSFFKFFLFGFELGKKKEKSGKKKKKRAAQNKEKRTAQNKEKRTAQSKEKSASASQKEEPEHKAAEPSMIEEKTKPAKAQITAEDLHSSKLKRTVDREIHGRKKKREERTQQAARKKKEKSTSIPEKICMLIDKLVDAIEHFEETCDRLVRKYETVMAKIEPLLDTRSGNFYKKVWRRVKRMLSHWRIRRISGYLDFGTGQPDQTGMLTGVIYMLLPAGADRFEVTPEIWDRAFDTDFDCKGHIRLWHALIAAVPTLLDKDFRRTLRLLRKFRGGK